MQRENTVQCLERVLHFHAETSKQVQEKQKCNPLPYVTTVCMLDDQVSV